MSKIIKSDTDKSQPNGYVLRAVRRIIVPKGMKTVEVSIAGNHVKIDSNHSNVPTTSPNNSENKTERK